MNAVPQAPRDSAMHPEEWQARVQLAAAFVCEGLAVTRCIRGQAVADGMGRFIEAVGSL